MLPLCFEFMHHCCSCSTPMLLFGDFEMSIIYHAEHKSLKSFLLFFLEVLSLESNNKDNMLHWDRIKNKNDTPDLVCTSPRTEPPDQATRWI